MPAFAQEARAGRSQLRTAGVPGRRDSILRRPQTAAWRTSWTAAAPFLSLIAGLKAASAARPDSSQVIRRAKSIERLRLMKRRLECFLTGGAKPWPAPIPRGGCRRCRALVTVFSKALWFRIGGVSVMPSLLVLADATASKGRAGQAVTRGRASRHQIGDVLRPGGEPLLGTVYSGFHTWFSAENFLVCPSARRKRTC